MYRYHKKIYFPDIKKLQVLNDKLNMYNWQYSKHAIDNLQYRSIDINAILMFIKNIKLKYDNIFEYYVKDDNIIKVCYRINFNNYTDLILVLNKYKKIITIYLNNKDDKHYTLKRELYQSA